MNAITVLDNLADKVSSFGCASESDRILECLHAHSNGMGWDAEEAKAELAELKTFFPLLLDFPAAIYQSGNGW